VTWLFKVLLRLYPADFRARYGSEVLAAAADAQEEARGAPLAVRMRLLAFSVRDVVGAAMRQRFRRVRTSTISALGGGHPQPSRQSKRSEMDTILQDIRYALRLFVRRPGFAAVAVISLALAIGGNTAIYGILDGFVFHPFSYPDPDRLVAVGVNYPKLSSETSYIEVLSPAEYADIRTAGSFASIGAFDLGNRNISGGDVPERVFTALLLDDLFPVLGMKPVLGRGFTRDELLPNGPPVAIISHRLWRTRFAEDPAILSRAVRISGQSTAIVGVMPPGLVLIGTDLWMPWGGDPARMPRNIRQFSILARLAPRASIEQANTELTTIAGRIDQAERAKFKEYEGWRLTATPWAAALMQDVRPVAYMLVGAVAFVLLIACANLTNLFLARSTTRHRELAVRLALGAGRWRVARHVLTESLLLSFAGAAGGLLVAYLAFRGSSSLIPAQFQMLGLEAGLNTRVLAWSAAVALACGLLAALLPALQATRTDPHDSLKADTRAGGNRGGRLRQLLVISEIALSVVLLLGAGVLIRSMWNIQRVDPGFQSDGVLTMRLTLPRERYAEDAAGAFFDSLIERLEAVPGVRSASAASQFPPMAAFDTQFTLEHKVEPGSTLPTALSTVASPGYFATLGVPIQAGRAFNASDRLNTPPVVIVNAAFAARYLSGADPVGQRIQMGSPERPRPAATIVGVVADFRNAGATQAVRPELFIPVRQQTVWNQLFVLVRSEGTAAAILPAVRQTVQSLDAEQPIYMIQSLDEALAVSSFQQRASAIVLGLFALLAMVLAAMGIYGVMSYSVSARTQEMGVRFALGAQRGSVLWLVIRQVLLLAAIGLTIGVVLLVFAGRALEQLLFGVKAVDPLTIVLVTLALGAVALVAAWVPASRASRIDPITALRYE
jgi:putative ABC transport system permease protein